MWCPTPKSPSLNFLLKIVLFTFVNNNEEDSNLLEKPYRNLTVTKFHGDKSEEAVGTAFFGSTDRRATRSRSHAPSVTRSVFDEFANAK